MPVLVILPVESSTTTKQERHTNLSNLAALRPSPTGFASPQPPAAKPFVF